MERAAPADLGSDSRRSIRDEVGIFGLVSFDCHLECAIQELTAFAKTLEGEAVEHNGRLQVRFNHKALVNRLQLEQADGESHVQPRVPPQLEENLANVLRSAAFKLDC